MLNKNRHLFAYLLLFYSCLMMNAYGKQTDSSFSKKALLIGIDGLQLERMQVLDTPNFDRLKILKAYTGGVKGAVSEQRTVSGPGWSTVLTGVWRNKHRISSNDDGAANASWPSIFRYIHESRLGAQIYSFSTWKPIHSHFFARDVPLMAAHAEGGNDANYTQIAQKVLESASPDFMFIHLDAPDIAGHAKGFGEEYDKAILDSDERLGLLLDAVELRERELQENWLVLVTTDHGRDRRGKHHGGQTTNEKTIFIASNKALALPEEPYASGVSKAFDGLYELPAQTFIVPTILYFMDAFNDRHWALDGLPLIDPAEVSQQSIAVTTHRIFSRIDDTNCGLEWDVNAGTPTTLESQEHLAKFDCNESADPMMVTGNQVYTFIQGSSCGLQWDADKGDLLTLDQEERVAKFDCNNPGDVLALGKEYLAADIEGVRCGFQWDANAGSLLTLGPKEHLAKFDCAGNPDVLFWDSPTVLER